MCGTSLVAINLVVSRYLPKISLITVKTVYIFYTLYMFILFVLFILLILFTLFSHSPVACSDRNRLDS